MKLQSPAVRQMAQDSAKLAAPTAPVADKGQAVADPLDSVVPEAEKDWTVLFYLNGNNAQSSQMIADLRQLEYVGSNANANLVAQVARPAALLDTPEGFKSVGSTVGLVGGGAGGYFLGSHFAAPLAASALSAVGLPNVSPSLVSGVAGAAVGALAGRKLGQAGGSKLANKMAGDWSGTRRYFIQHNGEKLTPAVLIGDSLTSSLPGKTKGIKSPVLEDLGPKVDMASGETLEQFIEWGMKKYPSKHVMVVMQGPSAGLSGFQFDTESGNKMTAAQLGDAMRHVSEKTGKKIDIVALNGSATNTAEVAYELRDSAKYLVGSQGLQSGGGMPTAFVMNEIQNVNKHKSTEPLEVIGYWMLMNSMAASTLSTIDLDKMGGVKESWNNLSQALLDANVSSEKLHSLLENTQDFQGRSTNQAYQNSKDAIHFAKLVKEDAEITDPKVKEAAQAAIDNIELALQAGGATSGGKYVSEAHGLSVFGPTHYGFFRPEGSKAPDDASEPLRDAEYSKTAFAKDTVWDDVLTKAAEDTRVNNALKKVGFSEAKIDGLHTTYNKHIGKVNGVAKLAGMAAWSNAMNAWRGGSPIMGPFTAYAGAAASGLEAIKGVGEMIYAGTELHDTDEVVHKGFDVAKSLCMGAANLGMVVPQLKPYAATAGMLMFMSPWIRDVYGISENYRHIRDGVELGLSGNNAPTTTKMGDAVRNYFGTRDLHDHHERSAWQKISG